MYVDEGELIARLREAPPIEMDEECQAEKPKRKRNMVQPLPRAAAWYFSGWICSRTTPLVLSSAEKCKKRTAMPASTAANPAKGKTYDERMMGCKNERHLCACV